MFLKRNKINYTLAFLFLFFVFFTSCKKKQKFSSINDITVATAQEDIQTYDFIREKKGNKVHLTVFAASSLTNSLKNIADLYQKSGHKNVEFFFNFASSGVLKQQIELGAPADIFISASVNYMDAIDLASPNSPRKGKNFIDHSTRCNLLTNKVVLAVPPKSNKNIGDFYDMAAKARDKKLLIALGNKDVPVGKYSSELLEFLGVNEKELSLYGKISYYGSAKEVSSAIKNGLVDCGLVFCSDAITDSLVIKDYSKEEMTSNIIYPAAVLSKSTNAQEAKEFLEFLQTKESRGIYEKDGFTLIE